MRQPQKLDLTLMNTLVHFERWWNLCVTGHPKGPDILQKQAEYRIKLAKSLTDLSALFAKHTENE